MNIVWFSLKNQKNTKAYGIIGLLFLIGICACSQDTKVEKLGLKQKVLSTSVFDAIQKKYIAHLTDAKTSLDSLLQTNNPELIQHYWQKSRVAFKYAEPIMAYVHGEHYKYLNGPNILKVYEDDFQDIKVLKPTGYQVLEETIYVDEYTKLDLQAVYEHASKTRDRLRFIISNTDLQSYKDYHFFWLIRDAIIRVGTTGITGFDSPVLAQSIEESKWVYQSIEELLESYSQWNTSNKPKKELLTFKRAVSSSVDELTGNFNSFDRYNFLKSHTQNELYLWKQTTDEQAITFPFELAIANNATSLFSTSTFNTSFFFDPNRPEFTNERAEIGKKLFNDVRLSSSNMMSCATCHIADLAFTDGKVISEKQSRNSPTLSYAVYQQAQFYDGRAASLEGQIVSVVENETEFHSDLSKMTQAIAKDEEYVQAFEKWYNGQLKEENIRNAIAHYVSSLGDFSSRFDQSMNDQSTDLTPEEIQGFNLFMGKASCATCHFPPLFNGTVPPTFRETEFEHLGTPETASSNQPKIDDDLGRYYLFNTEQRKHFFKTSTIRNAAKTAPYMHNGVYDDLYQLLDFYNVGGGYGLGIETEFQTLPPDSLHLTQSEIDAIIAFIESLTDKSI
jgi:cytochrome c peroxidase